MPSVSQLVAVTSLIALAACGDGIKGGASPTLEITDGGRSIALNDRVEVSALAPKFLKIENHGNADLEIDSISIVSEPAGAFELATENAPFVVPAEGNEDLTLYFHPELGADASAVVHIRAKRMAEFTFLVLPQASSGALVANPTTIDFKVPLQQTRSEPLHLANTGSAALQVTQFFLSGHTGFSVTIGEVTYPISGDTAAGITLPEPLTIDALSSVDLTVTYFAASEEGAEGELKLVSNDVNSAEGTIVKLYANLDAPCVHVSPQVVDFGGKPVGHAATIPVHIESCGERPLLVSDVQLTDDHGGLFTIDTSALGTEGVTIQPNEEVIVQATYTPAEIAQLDGSDAVRDEGKMTVYSDAVIDALEVKLTGFGVDPSCPVATITCQEEEEVAVQTTIHCSASASTSTSGITRYQWSVVQPDGSTSTIMPGPDARDIRFDPNVVGVYTFTLRVFDSYSTPSCVDATQTFHVTADGGIHVELLWDNSSTDFDQSDDFGADVDLHFMHPDSTGWFDEYYDANWINTNPDWDVTGNDRDDPSLDLDDVDGAGPENMNVAQPPSGRCYEIGAHYWDDWGFGQTKATVRVYIYGEMRFHWDDVRMNMLDMWEVGSVCWPSGNVEAHGGSVPQIQHDVDGGFGTGGTCDGFCDEDDFFGGGCIDDCF